MGKIKNEWTVFLTHGGKGACFPYAVNHYDFRMITVPWNFVKISKNLYLLIAVCKKLKIVAIDEVPFEHERRV